MYQIIVIDQDGPGKMLKSFHTVNEAREWLDDTGVAYDFYFGVAIYDTERDLFDCGDGEWSPLEDCWD